MFRRVEFKNIFRKVDTKQIFNLKVSRKRDQFQEIKKHKVSISDGWFITKERSISGDKEAQVSISDGWLASSCKS